MYVLLGFNHFNSKAGKPMCTVQLGREFSDLEKSKGSVGLKVVKRPNGGDYFVPDSQLDICNKDNINKKCDIWFTESNNIAQIVIR